MSDLSRSLGRVDEEVAFHILNGILYEIYFDSSDRFRQRLKIDKIEEVLALESDERFRASFQFIQQSLKLYYNRLVYIPGSGSTVRVDVVVKFREASKLEVKRIVFDSQDILYSFDGVTLIENSESPKLMEISANALESKLAVDMAVPRYRLTLIYSDGRVGTYPLQFPYDYKIQHLSS